MRNLYAFTEAPGGRVYPAYVSLNAQADGTVTLSVRTSGTPDSSQITLTAEQQLHLGQSLIGGKCRIPPFGWRCTRRAGHEGPCAAWPRLWNLRQWWRAWPWWCE